MEHPPSVREVKGLIPVGDWFFLCPTLVSCWSVHFSQCYSHYQWRLINANHTWYLLYVLCWRKYNQYLYNVKLDVTISIKNYFHPERLWKLLHQYIHQTICIKAFGLLCQKVILRSLDERNFSAQKTMHHLLSIKQVSSSFNVIPMNFARPKQDQVANGDIYKN